MSRPTSSYDFPYLSNQDVQLLYEIIEAAEASKRPPFRALFSAYDQVLRKHHINWESDQKYFRFLLRMREQNQSTLFAQFESLLRRLGIHVDFNKGEDTLAHEEVLQQSGHAGQTETAQLESTASPPRLGLGPRPAPKARRASFSSFQETTEALEYDERLRHRRQRSLDHERGGRVVEKTRPAAPASHIPRRPRPRQLQQQRPQPQAAISAPGRADAIPQPPYTEDFEVYDDQDTENVYHAGLAAANPVEQEHPEEHQLQAAARELRYHQIAAQSLRLFLSWVDKARQRSFQNSELEKLAELQDRRMLMGAALEEWHGKLLKRQAQQAEELETEIFYETLEHRATQARDVYLLTKAFTHWAQSASDEVLRTSAARRHILRIRYFNAWKDTTAVYEMKARRLPLAKFLTIWRGRAQAIRAAEGQAQEFHDRHLTVDTYHDWLWRFCDRKAPAWRANNLKANAFSDWLERTRRVDELDFLGHDFDEVRIVRSCAVSWASKTRQLQEADKAAIAFRQRRLLKATFASLHRAALLAPRSNLATLKHNTRAAQSALQVWRDRARLERQAKIVLQTRLLEKTISRWRDAVRVHTVQRLSNEHCVSTALRAWVTAGRLRLFQRVSVERTAHSVMHHWYQRASGISHELSDAAVQFNHLRNHQQASLALSTWRTRLHTLAELEQMAETHRSRHLLQTAMQPWKDLTTDIRSMHIRAARARFWVLAHPVLKRWGEALAEKAKERRRSAYATFRSYLKRKTASQILGVWRSRVQALTDMNRSAARFNDVLVRRLIKNTFVTWASRAGWVEQVNGEANTLYTLNLLSRFLNVMVERAGELEDLEGLADSLNQSRDARAAEVAMRSLNWALFQVRAKEATADGLRERNTARHARGFLRRWEGKARERRESALGAGAQTRSEAPLDDDEDDDDEEAVGHVPVLEPSLARLAAAGTPRPAHTATPGRFQAAQTVRLPRRPQFTPAAAGGPATPGPAAATTGRPFLKRLRAVTPAPATVGFKRRLGMVKEAETEETTIVDASPLRGRGT